MTEPTIICPNCNTEVKLNESLAAPLIAATRKQYEQQLAQKDNDIAKREQAMRDKEKQLVEDKRKREEQIERVMGATVGMYGDLQGIAGKSLQEIEGLEFPALEDGNAL